MKEKKFRALGKNKYKVSFKTEWPRASRIFEKHFKIAYAHSMKEVKRTIKSKYASMNPFAIKIERV